jgi:hypothetical protein
MCPEGGVEIYLWLNEGQSVGQVKAPHQRAAPQFILSIIHRPSWSKFYGVSDTAESIFSHEALSLRIDSQLGRKTT